MNTFQLECFIQVSETRSFAAAAKLLNVTQPAVTHQIRVLEEELNVRLFHRTTRHVELSPAGTAFLEDARTIVTTAMRAKRRFETPPAMRTVTLKLGIHAHHGLYPMTDILRRLCHEIPELHPSLQIVRYGSMFSELNEGVYDAVIGCEEPLSTLPKLNFLPLRTADVCCYCSEDTPLPDAPVTLEDLQPYRLIMIDPHDLPEAAARRQRSRIGERTESELFFAESIQSALTLAAAGLGLTILPRLQQVPPGLRCIPLANAAPLSFGIYSKTAHNNPLLTHCLDLLRTLH